MTSPAPRPDRRDCMYAWRRLIPITQRKPAESGKARHFSDARLTSSMRRPAVRRILLICACCYPAGQSRRRPGPDDDLEHAMSTPPRSPSTQNRPLSSHDPSPWPAPLTLLTPADSEASPRRLITARAGGVADLPSRAVTSWWVGSAWYSARAITIRAAAVCAVWRPTIAGRARKGLLGQGPGPARSCSTGVGAPGDQRWVSAHQAWVSR